MLTIPDDFPTITQAIQNATDGDIIFIKQGIYNETIVIDKAITLKGEDTNKTIINGNTTATVIQILHDNVTITGLTITYSLTPNSPRRYYQHDFPQDWWAVGGWSASGYPLDGGYFVRRTEFRLSGIHIMNAKNCCITGNIISDCGVGIRLWKATQNNITGNLLIQNDYGLQVESSKDNSFMGNTFQNNGGGIWLPQPNWVSGWGTDRKTINNTFTENNFIGNLKAIEPQCLTNTTNNWNGNYWNNNCNDNNQDGINDEPYQILGEYYTGGYHKHGVWTEQVYSVDNYPLMEPIDTASMFTVHQNVSDVQPASTTSDYTLIEVAVSVTGVIVIVGLIAYFKRNRTAF